MSLGVKGGVKQLQMDAWSLQKSKVQNDQSYKIKLRKQPKNVINELHIEA